MGFYACRGPDYYGLRQEWKCTNCRQCRSFTLSCVANVNSTKTTAYRCPLGWLRENHTYVVAAVDVDALGSSTLGYRTNTGPLLYPDEIGIFYECLPNAGWVVLLHCLLPNDLLVLFFFVGKTKKSSNKCQNRGMHGVIIIKIKIHSSCEIEYFVETHQISLQAVCDTPIARITGCVSSLRI